MYHRLFLVLALDPFCWSLIIVVFGADSIHTVATIDSVDGVVSVWLGEFDAIVHSDPHHFEIGHFVSIGEEAIELARVAALACVPWLARDLCSCPRLLAYCTWIHCAASVAILVRKQIVGAKDRSVQGILACDTHDNSYEIPTNAPNCDL